MVRLAESKIHLQNLVDARIGLFEKNVDAYHFECTFALLYFYAPAELR